MGMITCSDCGASISKSAKACPKCGSTKHRPKLWPWIIGVPICLFMLLLLIGSFTGPRTTLDLARMETEQCIRRNGDGEWTGSLGVTLERFCEAKGNLAAIKRGCEIDPSKC